MTVNKACVSCWVLFTPTGREKTCSKCEMKKLKTKERKEKAKRKKLLSLSKLNKHCDYLIWLYIRSKHKWDFCISCGKSWEPNFQAGHFIPRTNYGLRWSLANVYLQCPYCNGMLEGNKYLFWKNLNKIYGLETAEKLIEVSKKKYVNSIEDRLIFIWERYKDLDSMWVKRLHTYDDYIPNI